jgi:hypothetical protein
MPVEKVQQSNFLAGMNPDKADLLLNPEIGETAYLENMLMSKRPGALDHMGGNTYFNSVQGAADQTNVFASSIIRFYQSTGASYTVVAWDNVGTYGISVLTASTETEITDTLTAPVTDWAVYQDVLYFVNGTGFVYSWDGTTFASVATPVVGSTNFAPTLIEQHKGRMYYGGDEPLPSTVIYSEPGTPVLFESPFLSFVNVFDDDGDKITSLQSWGDNLYVFKTRRYYTLTKSPPTSIIPSESPGAGAFGKGVVQKTRFGLIFLGETAIYLLTSGGVRNIAPQVSATRLRTLTANSNGNFSSVFHKGIYYIFIQTAVAGQINGGFSLDFNTLDYGLQFPAISTVTNFPVAASTVYDGTVDAGEWYGCMAGTNNVLRLDGTAPTYYQDQANPSVRLPATILSRWLDGDAPWQVKELRVMYLYFHTAIEDLKATIEYELDATNGQYDVEFSVQEDASLWDQSLWDDALWNGEHVFMHRVVIPAGLYAHRWRVRVFSETKSTEVNLDRFEFGFLRVAEGL